MIIERRSFCQVSNLPDASINFKQAIYLSVRQGVTRVVARDRTRPH